jgi:hypothetical protein
MTGTNSAAVVSARLVGDPVSSKTSCGSAKFVNELPTCEIVRHYSDSRV